MQWIFINKFLCMLQNPSEEHTNHGLEFLRRKRAAQAEKNTCQLYIQTDHLFFRYYGTREAVIAQVCFSPLLFVLYLLMKLLYSL